MNALFCPGIRKELWDDSIIRSRLAGLANADKAKHWIHTDLSVSKSSCPARFFWATIAKRFNSLRQLYDINSAQSTAILERLGIYIHANGKDDLKPLYLSALTNFVCSIRRPPAFMPYNANTPQEPSGEVPILCCPIIGGPPLIETEAPNVEHVIHHVVAPMPPLMTSVLVHPVISSRPPTVAGRQIPGTGLRNPVRRVIASVPNHGIPVTIQPPVPTVAGRQIPGTGRREPLREVIPMVPTQRIPVAVQPPGPMVANREVPGAAIRDRTRAPDRVSRAPLAQRPNDIPSQNFRANIPTQANPMPGVRVVPGGRANR